MEEPESPKTGHTQSEDEFDFDDFQTPEVQLPAQPESPTAQDDDKEDDFGDFSGFEAAEPAPQAQTEFVQPSSPPPPPPEIKLVTTKSMLLEGRTKLQTTLTSTTTTTISLVSLSTILETYPAVQQAHIQRHKKWYFNDGRESTSSSAVPAQARLLARLGVAASEMTTTSFSPPMDSNTPVAFKPTVPRGTKTAVDDSDEEAVFADAFPIDTEEREREQQQQRQQQQHKLPPLSASQTAAITEMSTYYSAMETQPLENSSNASYTDARDDELVDDATSPQKKTVLLAVVAITNVRSEEKQKDDDEKEEEDRNERQEEKTDKQDKFVWEQATTTADFASTSNLEEEGIVADEQSFIEEQQQGDVEKFSAVDQQDNGDDDDDDHFAWETAADAVPTESNTVDHDSGIENLGDEERAGASQLSNVPELLVEPPFSSTASSLAAPTAEQQVEAEKGEELEISNEQGVDGSEDADEEPSLAAVIGAFKVTSVVDHHSQPAAAAVGAQNIINNEDDDDEWGEFNAFEASSPQTTTDSTAVIVACDVAKEDEKDGAIFVQFSPFAATAPKLDGDVIFENSSFPPSAAPAIEEEFSATIGSEITAAAAGDSDSISTNILFTNEVAVVDENNSNTAAAISLLPDEVDKREVNTSILQASHVDYNGIDAFMSHAAHSATDNTNGFTTAADSIDNNNDDEENNDDDDDFTDFESAPPLAATSNEAALYNLESQRKVKEEEEAAKQRAAEKAATIAAIGKLVEDIPDLSSLLSNTIQS